MARSPVQYQGDVVPHYVDSNGIPQPVTGSGSAQYVADVAVHPGEDATYNRTWGGNKADSKSAATGTGTVKTGAGFYYGYTVTTALSAAAITVYDNTAASGTVIEVIAASTAAGVTKNLATPVPLSNGIHASFGGTGTVLFLYT